MSMWWLIPAGKSSEKLTPSMEIPLDSGEFKIGSTLSPEDSGALTAAQMVSQPGAVGEEDKSCSVLGNIDFARGYPSAAD